MKKLLKRFISLVVICALCVVGYFGALGYTMYRSVTKERSIADRIEDIRSMENYTRLQDVPKIYKDAVISVEDERFYEHGGVDFISVFRAILINVKNNELSQGGSTITQQFAKNLLFSHEQSISRKMAEFFATYYIEKNYTKDEILELYMNVIYYGDGYYNIHSAATGYFDVIPEDLNDYQATMLAGIPNAPSVYAPTKNIDLAQKRQDKVLERMVEEKVLTEEQKEEILKER